MALQSGTGRQAGSYGDDDSSGRFGFEDFWRGLELAEIADDLGAGPGLGADELPAEDAVAVDDVGFGDLGGAVEGVDACVGVADGAEVDVVLLEEAAVDVVVLVHADADDGEVGHLVLEGEEAGELFDAGGAPGCPQIEDDDLAAKLGEVEALDAVGDGEGRSDAAEAVRVAAAITTDAEGRYCYQDCCCEMSSPHACLLPFL